MNVLALDLGTHTGFAFNHETYFECGTWDLATAKEVTAWGKARIDRRCDPRPRRLHAKILVLHEKYAFDYLIFEDVQFSSTTKQTQLWSALRAAIWLAFPAERIECVPVSTLKKFATGHGGATKDMMTASLLVQDARFSRRGGSKIIFADKVIDDNAIDAVHLWRWAKHNLSRTK